MDGNRTGGRGDEESGHGGGGGECPPIFICEKNRKSNKIKHCVDFLRVEVVKIGPYFGHLITFSILFTNKNGGGGPFQPGSLKQEPFFVASLKIYTYMVFSCILSLG